MIKVNLVVHFIVLKCIIHITEKAFYCLKRLQLLVTHNSLTENGTIKPRDIKWYRPWEKRSFSEFRQMRTFDECLQNNTFPHEVHHMIITKTYLYNFDPLKPHFYIVKLGFTGVYIIFLISAQNIDCVYSLEPPHRGGSNEYPQSMFWAEIWKISEFFIWKFSFLGGKIFIIFK